MSATRGRVPQATERLFLVFAALMVLIIGTLSYIAWLNYGRSNEEVGTTQQVIDGTNSLLSSLKDAETAQRGFLLTGETRYLDPYRRAAMDVPTVLDKLSRVTARQRPDEARLFERLRPLIQAKFDELGQTIEVRRSQGPEAAIAIVRTNRGQTIMDRIRAECAEIQSVADRRLTRFSEDSRASATRLALISTIGSAGLFLLLLLASAAIRRAARRREELIESLSRSAAQATQSRDWLQTTINSIGDGVITTDAQGKVSQLNVVAESLTGWKQQQAAGKPLEQVFVIRNAETGLAVENPVAKALREGRIVGLANHTRLIASDGRHIPIDDSAAPIHDGGRIAGVVLVFRDVTERKRAEERLLAANEELRRTTHLMEPVVCFVLDLQDSRIVYWNPGAADLYGFSADEALGKNGHLLLKTEFPAPLDKIQAQLLTAGAWDGELSHARRDGRRLTVASHWALHRGADGRPAAILEVNVDITERRRIEEKLRVANQALARANEDLNQFAFAASHDLQEPLRMITIYSQLLLKSYRGQLDGEAATFTAVITEGTDRMLALLADLLAYTQLTGDTRGPAGSVDLNQVFQKALENCRAAIDETAATVTSDALPAVLGEESHFLQLFQNLISNALKYRGEVPPHIHVSAEKQNGLWRIAVKDNGVGIAPEYHKKIFGVFKRLHGRSIAGTGMGLAICQRVVERYGGRIWVESEPDHGATFYFTLPAVQTEVVYDGA